MVKFFVHFLAGFVLVEVTRIKYLNSDNKPESFEFKLDRVTRFDGNTATEMKFDRSQEYEQLSTFGAHPTLHKFAITSDHELELLDLIEEKLGDPKTVDWTNFPINDSRSFNNHQIYVTKNTLWMPIDSRQYFGK